MSDTFLGTVLVVLRFQTLQISPSSHLPKDSFPKPQRLNPVLHTHGHLLPWDPLDVAELTSSSPVWRQVLKARPASCLLLAFSNPAPTNWKEVLHGHSLSRRKDSKGREGHG